MPSKADRSHYQRQRATVVPANNSVRRTYDLLRARLANIAPETLLVEEQLVRELSASRNTVRIVLQRLAAEGLICRSPKVGTHTFYSVTIPVDELIPFPELPGRKPMERRLLETSVIPAPMLVAERLELPPDSQVRVIEGAMVDGSTPVALTVSYVGVTAEDQTDLHEPISDSAIWFVEELLQVPVVRADTIVAALACDAQTAALLEVPEGSPILLLEDLLRDVDDRPCALSQYRFRSDRVTLSATAWRQGARLPTKQAC
jgi:GntR family transcriptional regulator